jgi:hypothetical protein
MSDVCKECEDGRWECGEEGQVCSAGEDWERLGDCYIPVGVGNMVVVVTVYTTMIKDKCVVRVVKHCPKHCKKSFEGEIGVA